MAVAKLPGKKSPRLTFTFDDRAYEGLMRVQKRFKAKSVAEAVRLSLQLADSILAQAKQGYEEIVVRNPRTDKMKVMAGSLTTVGDSDE